MGGGGWVGLGIVVDRRGDWKGGVGRWGRFAHGCGCWGFKIVEKSKTTPPRHPAGVDVVVYDFERQMEGAILRKCSEFEDDIIEHME